MEPNNTTPTEEVEKKESIWDLVRFIIITLLIVIPVRAYVAQPFIVSGESMVPTFDDGEYLIIDELTYHVREPERGEVVVFRYPNDPSKFFIKRVIGLPGETVVLQGTKTSVIDTSGKTITLDEPYISAPFSITETLELKEGEYFVMGDNRPVSSDSRVWGPLPRDNIKGRVLFRLLPVNRAGVWPGVATSTETGN
jgi:signal peptidase I